MHIRGFQGIENLIVTSKFIVVHYTKNDERDIPFYILKEERGRDYL